MGSDTSDKATADAAARAEATSTTAALGVDKKRKAKRRVPRATVVTIMSAIIVFIIAQNVPELVISTIKPLPINTTRTIQTEPASTVFYDPSLTCSESDGNDCYITEATTQWITVLNSTKGQVIDTKGKPMKNVAQLDVTQKLIRTDSQSPLVNITDKLHLLRGSAHPILLPTSQMEVTTGGFGVNFNTGTFARDGLQYFLPFNTERRSYSYFDVFAQAAFPLDYVRTERRGHNDLVPDSDVFVFHQQLPVMNLASAAARSFNHPDDISDAPGETIIESDLPQQQREQIGNMLLTGPESKFYPSGSDNSVTLAPFYTATRTLWVEASSGVIVDEQEEMHLFFAMDSADAEKTAQEGVNMYRTMLHTSTTWNQETKDSAKAWAEPVVSIMYWLRFGAFVLKYLAGTLLIYGFWRYTQIVRRAENTASLTTPAAPPEPPASPKA